jgi:hypothetical protein
MFVSCTVFVLSNPITRPAESYSISVNQKPPKAGRQPRPDLGCCATGKNCEPSVRMSVFI